MRSLAALKSLSSPLALALGRVYLELSFSRARGSSRGAARRDGERWRVINSPTRKIESTFGRSTEAANKATLGGSLNAAAAAAECQRRASHESSAAAAQHERMIANCGDFRASPSRRAAAEQVRLLMTTVRGGGCSCAQTINRFKALLVGGRSRAERGRP